MRSAAGRKEGSRERWWCGPCAGIQELRVNQLPKLETILPEVARAAATLQQVVVATLHLQTLVVVGTLHLLTTSQHLEFTQPYPRAGLLAQATQEPHQWGVTQELDIQLRELWGSLGWFTHLCLPLPRQHYPTQFNRAREWSTKVSNHLLDLDLSRGKAILEGRTARV